MSCDCWSAEGHLTCLPPPHTVFITFCISGLSQPQAGTRHILARMCKKALDVRDAPRAPPDANHGDHQMRHRTSFIDCRTSSLQKCKEMSKPMSERVLDSHRMISGQSHHWEVATATTCERAAQRKWTHLEMSTGKTSRTKAKSKTTVPEDKLEKSY